MLLWSYDTVVVVHCFTTIIPSSPSTILHGRRRRMDGLFVLRESSVQQQEETSMRRVVMVEEATRLPVWPVWNGVLLFVLSKIFGKSVAAKLEDVFGGRVCPMSLSSSPFVLLVHHRHSFAKYDLFRWIQQQFILPEGFPAHPHRGFITLTYILQGGMKHRDSLGIQQIYKQHQTQWLYTGSGMLHEEMWDNDDNISQQELYQLWINVPSRFKLNPPSVVLLGNDTQYPTPIVTSIDKKCHTTILYGQHESTSQPYICPEQPNVNVFHVELQPHSTWTHSFLTTTDISVDFHETVLVYVRKGTIQITNKEIPTHALVTLSKEEDIVTLTSGKEGADILFLSGKDLKEPIEQQGSMVMNTPQEIQKAYFDYQSGKMGIPWDQTLTDDEWKQHIQKQKQIQQNNINAVE